MIDRLINNVLDVPGVDGLCIFDKEGRALMDYLPEYVVAELLVDMLQRAVSLYETVDENFVPCDDYLLKYPGKWIMLRRSKGAFMITIMSEEANQVTLKMTSNLLLKNINVAELTPLEEPQAIARPAAVPRNTRAPMPRNTRAPMPQQAPVVTRKVSAPVPKPKRSFRGNTY